MQLIHLKDLPASAISDFLLPYIKYLSNPLSGAKISAKNSAEAYTIPSNVWFITELEKGSLVENIPAYILEYATLLALKFAVCQPAEAKSEFVPITLTDSGGNEVISHTPELPFGVVILSSPAIIKGEAYTITVGAASGTFTAN